MRPWTVTKCGTSEGALAEASSGSITDNGYNLEDDTSSTCGFSAGQHDIVGQNPQLGSLADNGGPTQTMALLSDSPAIDANTCSFKDATGNTITTDQRGYPRPDNGETVCDIGAYEFQNDTTTTLTSHPNPSVVGQQVTYTATVSPVPDGGTVAFSDGGTPISGCGAQSVNTTTGTATCTVTYTSVGSHSITAAYSGDSAFHASTSAPLTQLVQYGVKLIYKPPMVLKSGRTVAIKLQLVDAAGHNLSSANLAVQALCIVPQGTTTCAGAVITYTNQSFTYMASLLGYQFNVRTTGLTVGKTYQLLFRAAGEDPSIFHTDANASFMITK